MRIILTIACVAVLGSLGCGFKSESVDLIVHNGNILTLDFQNNRAQALAVRDGRIIDLGADRAILNKYRASEYMDLRSGILMPGLMDGHAHFVGYADGLLEANLVGTKSWEEAVKRLQEQQLTWPSEWAVGRGWDQNDWLTQDFPDRSLLDSLFPNQPVVLERIDGHAVIANAEALRRAGLFDARARQVEGGEIVRDEDGMPSGVLIDRACELVHQHVPKHSNAKRLEALKTAQSNLLKMGIVGVTDAGLSPGDIERLDSLQDVGILKLRINALVSASEENISWLVSEGQRVEDRLVVNGVKFYMDGALGSRGALLRAPYSDRPNWYGLATQEMELYRSQLETLHQNGLQAATHCIGDSAVQLVLDAYGKLLQGTNDRRWRIEHAQVVSREDVERFAAHSIVPSVQPTHATSDMYWAGERLGRNRIRRAYAYQELLQTIGMLTLGTDFPVEDIDPRKTFVSAVARVDASGYPEGGFQSENALTPEQAMRGMTQWVGMAQFQEADLGTIETGKKADFVWVDRNWLEIAPKDVLGSRIFGTCINGEWCYLENSLE